MGHGIHRLGGFWGWSLCFPPWSPFTLFWRKPDTMFESLSPLCCKEAKARHMEKSHKGGDAWPVLAVLLQPLGWLCEWGSHLSIQPVKLSAVTSTEQHLTVTNGEAPCKNCLSESINPQILEIMIEYGDRTRELEQSLFQKGPPQVRRDTPNLSCPLTNGGGATQSFL